MLGATLVLITALAAPEITVKPGTAIEFDGRVESAEWADAYVLPVAYQDGGRLELRLKRNGRWLALGLSGARAYAGEAVQMQVADEFGAWVTDLYFGVGQPAMPPLVWRRGAPMFLPRQEPGLTAECPRAARLRVDVARADGWSAEYLIRLSAFGIGRGDDRAFRCRLFVSRSVPALEGLFAYPPTSEEFEPDTFMPLVAPDGWGRDETWDPVSPEISREFDDNEFLFGLFREFARFDDDADQKPISHATQPRTLARIRALEAKLEAGAARNPTLPSWKYYLGELAHRANFHERVQAIVESVPPHLARLEPLVILAAEHYVATEQWARAFEVCDANQKTHGIVEHVKSVLAGRRMARAEREAIAQDEAKPEPNPRVRLVVRDKGAIVIELFEDDARNAVLNFMDLAFNRKFYDGLRFHEVVGASHVALGDPATRAGAAADEDGPPWRLKPDDSARPMLRGYVATVPNEAGPEQHGSRFTIAVVPLFEDDARGTVFGRVVEGLDIVENIESDDRLERIEVVRKRNHTYDPLPARNQ